MKIMFAKINFHDEFYQKLKLLVLPITMQQFMLALVSATDAIMLGAVSQTSLSAVSLAGQIQFVLNLFMVKGDVIWSLGFLHITRQGVRTAVFLGIRLVLLIIGSSMLTLTTKPISLTDGIEKLLSPMKKIGVPAHELAMMMTIALRFIPTLLEETDKIMKAQQARGADFESGNLIRRAKSLIPILVPLFISAFRIASELAMAMEARCYRGDEGRTRMNEMKLEGRDAVAGLLLAAFLAATIAEAVIL